MNKFVKGLLLALVVVAPIAIAAPAVKAQDVHPHNPHKHTNVRRNNRTNVRTNKSVKRQHHTVTQTRHVKKHHVNNHPQN